MKLFVLYIFTSLLTISNQCIALNGVVRDPSNNPIPYCYVFIKGSGIGTVSNEEGLFGIRIKSYEDTLVFKRIGFIGKEIPINHLDTSVNIFVVLEIEKFELSQVNVFREKNIKTEELGNFEDQINNFEILGNGSEMAVKFEVKRFPFYLTEISFRINNVMNDKVIPIRIKIYNVDTVSGNPMNEILLSNLILNKKAKNKWITIDLIPYSVLIDNNTFFVSVETFEWSLPTFNFTKPPKRYDGLLFPFTRTQSQAVYFRNIQTTGYYKWAKSNYMFPLFRAKVTVD